MQVQGGEVTEQYVSYVEARARGGAGLIVLEAAYLDEGGRLMLGNLAIYADEFIPGLARLADVIKAYGSVAACPRRTSWREEPFPAALRRHFSTVRVTTSHTSHGVNKSLFGLALS